MPKKIKGSVTMTSHQNREYQYQYIQVVIQVIKND